MKPPSPARYRAAIAELRDAGIPDGHIAMLRAHYAAGPRGLTAAELAKAAGYPNYHSVNLQYGTFARRLAEKLGVDPSPNAEVIETWDLDVRNRRGHLLFPMRPQLAQALESLGLVSALFPDNIREPQRYPEGARKQVVVNAYERNEQARAACIAHYGARCIACKFDFGAQYGELGAGVIHVHHVKPVAEIGKEYQVDPIKDLRPVCPNCHTMIHRRKVPLSVLKAKSLVRMRFPWANRSA